MQYEDYKKGALVTESHISQNAKYPIHQFIAILRLQMRVGEVIDLMKRETFYGKALDDRDQQYRAAFERVQSALQQCSFAMFTPDYASTGERVEKTKVDLRLLHSVLGFASEAGEMSENLCKAFALGEMPAQQLFNMLEEIGDLNWYIMPALDSLGVELPAVYDMNNAKLRKRFPDGFESSRAYQRDIDMENDAGLQALIKAAAEEAAQNHDTHGEDQ